MHIVIIGRIWQGLLICTFNIMTIFFHLILMKFLKLKLIIMITVEMLVFHDKVGGLHHERA
jgi:hypothetical protein